MKIILFLLFLIHFTSALNIIEAQQIISKKLDNEYISKAKSDNCNSKQISFFSKLPNY
jgi:hypothetical protein